MPVLSALASLATLAIAFIPLERAFAARKQPVFRREWLTDLAFFLGQSWIWSASVVAALGLLGAALSPHLAPLQHAVSLQPVWVQGLLAVLLGDLLVYWGHRLSHRVPLLWRFHRVHHSAEQLDWLAAYREHPFDGLYTQLLVNLPGIVMGFPIELIAGVAAFRSLWGVFIHSNVRLPIGPLGVLVGSPDLHHFHHDRERGGSYNFANLSPLLDLIFGTYHAPKREPDALGIDDEVPRGYLGQLVHPLLPERLGRRLLAASRARARFKESLGSAPGV